MKPDELKQLVYGHHCLNDDQLAEIETAHNEAITAEPGEWRVRNERVVRYGAWMPVVATVALQFLAMTYSWIPRLLRCVRTLESALRSANISANSARRELSEERDRHRATIERVAKSEHGPMSDLEAIIEAIELGGANPKLHMYVFAYSGRPHDEIRKSLIEKYAKLLGAWAKGQQIEGDFYNDPDVESLRRSKIETDRFAAEEKKEFTEQRALVAALAEELKLTKAQREAHVERAKKRVTTTKD